MYAQSSNVKIFRGGVRALIACLIAFAIVFTQVKVDVFAETKKVRYYDRDANTEKEVSAEVVTEDVREWGAAGQTKWYVVKDNITQENVA